MAWRREDFPSKESIKIYVNGEEFETQKGIPLSIALISKGEWFISSSVKYYRPRGVISLDSYNRSTLVNVNGIPNINPNNLICNEGLRINLLKSKKPLLLSLTKDFLEAGFQHKFLVRKPFIWKIVKKFLFKYANYHEKPNKDATPATLEDPEEINADIVVVGGGIAGLTAAIEASKMGLETIIIDDKVRLGGRSIFDNSTPYGFDESLREFTSSLINETKKLGIKFYTQTVLNGFWEDGVIAYKLEEPSGGRIYYINSKLYVMATGSIELPCIYENNDLPGSITASTALQLVNEYNIKFAEKVALIGLTDYSVRVAIQLVDKGIDVTIITKDSNLRVLGETEKSLMERGIRIFKSVREVKAIGDQKVNALIIHSDEGKNHIDIDAVIFGAFENSNFKLPAQAGVEVKYFDKIGFVPIHNELMETKVENVLLAGGVTGSVFEILRYYEGKIAGITAAIKLGINGKEARSKVLKEYREIAKKLDALHIKSSVYDYYSNGKMKKTIIRNVPTLYTSKFSGNKFICFCEDITLKDLHKTINDIGFSRMELIKRFTGISTGTCQGRLCLINASLITSKISNIDVNEVGLITQRTPIIPIPLRVISEVNFE